jgi:hypothetical protein
MTYGLSVSSFLGQNTTELKRNTNTKATQGHGQTHWKCTTHDGQFGRCQWRHKLSCSSIGQESTASSVDLSAISLALMTNTCEPWFYERAAWRFSARSLWSRN